MNNIHKKSLISGFFDNYIDTSADSTVRIDLSFENDNILYKLYSNDIVKMSFKLDYNIVKNNSKFNEQTAWGLTLACVNAIFSSTENNVEYVITDNDLVQIFNKTLATKPPVLALVNDRVIFTPLLTFFVPYISSGVNDIKIYLPYSENSGEGALQITYSFNDEELENLPESTSLKDDIEPISITTDKDNSPITESDIINVTLTANPSIKFVYVEEKFGKVSKSLVRLNNGVGTFTVDTQDLLSGDNVEFKVGYKYFTGVSSFSKQIS
jgi:hypothetical protein